MPRTRRIAPVVMVIVLAASCAIPHQVAAEAQIPDQVDTAAVVSGNDAFALDLYARLRGQEGNLFLSPYSISTALAMTYAGARGETAAQMRDVLHFTLEDERLHRAFRSLIDSTTPGQDGGYALSVANALWGQEGYEFLPAFLDLTRTNYGAGLRQVDFVGATEAARKTINAWVEEETQEKIRDLLAPGVLTPYTRLVLTNAIYFKGDWASQFKESNTADAPFTLAGGENVQVPMMHQTEDFRYLETDDFQAISLPYVREDLSMVVFLPKETDGLTAFEEQLTPERLSQWLGGLYKREVRVFLPKFTMTSQFSLAEVLSEMGMPDAFTDAADFSGMSGKRDLFLSAVIHKAFVDVNEEGTEAAAATAVVIAATSVMPRPVTFRADHPFLFLIRDNRSGSILFMGRVMDPRG